jgi:hypothetical protein
MAECGTTTAYVAGCRCEECREANRSYHRAYRLSDQGRDKTRVHSKTRRNAEILALAYLRKHDRKAYFSVYDEARDKARAHFINEGDSNG